MKVIDSGSKWTESEQVSINHQKTLYAKNSVKTDIQVFILSDNTKVKY